MLILILASSAMAFSVPNEKLRIVNNPPYVPSPIAPEFHKNYIAEHYVMVIEPNESITYVEVIN